MACQRFTDALKARALGAPLGADAAAHLAICSNCQATLDAEERLLAAIDRALNDVGSVRPAPNLMARMRAHVEQPATPTPIPWMIAGAVVAAAALVAVLIVGRATHGDPAGHEALAPQPVQPIVEVTAEQAADAPVTLRRPATTGRARVARQLAVKREPAAGMPEVLVPVQERQAVGRLFEALRAGRPDVVASLLSIGNVGPVAEHQELTIAPIQIDPVVVSALPLSPPILDK